ncbi:MAG: ribonuclease P protein component [Bacteroidales bacterium]|nr:ribonuclease P protein component [Bacteroidales bacterium]
MAATLPKAERLSGRSAISALLTEGRWEHTSHLRCCFRQDNGLEYNRIMVSVPKRWFKRAVRRNLLKRRMREAYRTQKDLLPAGQAGGTDIMFVFNAREVAPFDVIREEVAQLLGKLAAR